jgi:hypothetical protein
MRSFVTLVCISVLLSGCSSTYTIRPDETLYKDTTLNYEQFHQKTAGKRLTVRLADGKEYDVQNVRLTADTARFELKKGGGVCMPICDIVSFRKYDHQGGAAIGWLYGSALGFVIGALHDIRIGLNSELTGGGDDHSMKGLGTGLLLGGAVGALAGSPQSWTLKYRLVHDSTAAGRK